MGGPRKPRIDIDEVDRAFREAVNMTARELERWLVTEQSLSVGFRREGAKESVGHESGRRIVAILRKSKAERDPADVQHMRKVVGFVRRHLAQRPGDDIMHTRWRYSLMNWGHDPLKD